MLMPGGVTFLLTRVHLEKLCSNLPDLGGYFLCTDAGIDYTTSKKSLHDNSRLKENEPQQHKTISGRAATLALILLEAGINQSIPFHSVIIKGPVALL